MAYKLIQGSQAVYRIEDGAFIPNDPANIDWQAYQAWLVAGNTAQAPDPPPPQTLAQQAQIMLASGCQIASTSAPALNGTYACDPESRTDIQAEIISLLLNSTFTNGGTAIDWPDASGAMHTFGAEQFKDFATKLGAFVGTAKPIAAGKVGTLPAQPVTIA